VLDRSFRPLDIGPREVVRPHVPYDVQDVDADFKRLAWRLGGAGECTRNYSGSPISNVQTSELVA
jgi:hypothetical protein